MARYQPGQSGNPRGRPKGAKTQNRKTAEQLAYIKLKSLLSLALKTLEQAMRDGDVSAARIIIDRCLPTIKAKDQLLSLPTLVAAPLEARGDIILQAVAEKHISPEQGKTLTALVDSQLKQREMTEFAAFLTRIQNGEDPVVVARSLAERHGDTAH